MNTFSTQPSVSAIRGTNNPDGYWVEGMWFQDLTWFPVVQRLKYLDWQFRLESNALIIEFMAQNSLTGNREKFTHRFALPTTYLTPMEQQRWLFDQIMYVHMHEAREQFKIDNQQPYFPNHYTGVFEDVYGSP